MKKITCWIAAFTSRIASKTSFFSTNFNKWIIIIKKEFVTSEYLILAKASDILISDSNCLGVAYIIIINIYIYIIPVIVFLLPPNFLISTYPCMRSWMHSFVIFGWIYFLAKEIYSDNNSISIIS